MCLVAHIPGVFLQRAKMTKMHNKDVLSKFQGREQRMLDARSSNIVQLKAYYCGLPAVHF